MKGIPIWIAGWLLILAAAGIVLGLLELLNPGSSGVLSVDTDLESGALAARGWGGRSLALGVTAVIALVLRERGAFGVALAGAIAREASDLYSAVAESQGFIDYALPAVMGAISVVAFLGVLGSAWTNRRGRDDLAPPDEPPTMESMI